MKLSPTRDRVIIEPDRDVGEKTLESGIILQEARKETATTQGVIVAKGPECSDDIQVGRYNRPCRLYNRPCRLYNRLCRLYDRLCRTGVPRRPEERVVPSMHPGEHCPVEYRRRVRLRLQVETVIGY